MSIAAIIIQIVLALGFLMFGASKLGSKQMVDEFTRYGMPQWFRVITGLLEIAGAALLVAGIWNDRLVVFGGWLLVVIMVGAVITHLRIKDPVSKIGMPVILIILTLVVLLIK
ncbi:DoxX family protein [Paenibacillus alginolyticus]|uniref:DoxX family protein n=1 Tax=Paenibacillus alginolyticus TaxID=59839 RepID=A0ABT4GLB9_9BACL|nr:DoxX family protein [Paenibacillus alginolyticus]MCY9666048.1 DoxX family protein [Paenibacillus alginolyticus]MCY9697007.1 DoxX family protein [Paenibacillus alginolyticus]MEC0148439.1 DoxX family protein [Paenibacillus alginolyticus]